MKQLEPAIGMKYIKNDGKTGQEYAKSNGKQARVPPMFWRNEKEVPGSATLSIYCTYLS